MHLLALRAPGRAFGGICAIVGTSNWYLIELCVRLIRMEAQTPTPLRFRKLRIAFSAVSGILCLTLIALWVRSYWWNDILSISFDGQRAYIVRSVSGEWGFFLEGQATHEHGLRWHSEPSIGGRNPPSFLGFRWGVVRNLRWPVIPIWFPVVLTATAAAIPWVKRRFRLRTLLIATAVLAAILGIVVNTT